MATESAPTKSALPESADDGLSTAATAFDSILGISRPDAKSTGKAPPAPAKAAASQDRTPDPEDEDPDVDPDDDIDPDAVADEAEPEDDPEYEVQVAGAPVKAKLSEILADYGKGKDYTAKTQAVAEDRRVLFEYATEAKAERELFVTRAQELTATLKALEPSKEDWEAMKTANPLQYANARDEWAKMVEKRDLAIQEANEAVEVDKREQARQYDQFCRAEDAKIREVLPVLFDSQKGPKVKERIFKYGESVGYSREALAQAVDHREVLTLYKAMRYDEIQAAKAKGQKSVNNDRPDPKPQQGLTRVATPTRRNPSEARTRFAKAQQALSKSGRVEDAASAFDAMLRS